MQHKVTALLYGFLTWLIPFVASIFCYSKQGELLVPYGLFKSIMVVVGSLSSMFLIIRYYRHVHKDYLKTGISVGILWFIINIGLDVLVLLPMAKMTFGEYFPQIGLGYFAIPIYVIGVGYLLQKKNSDKKV